MSHYTKGKRIPFGFHQGPYSPYGVLWVEPSEDSISMIRNGLKFGPVARIQWKGK